MHMACSNMIFISKQLVGCLLAFSLACLGTTAQAAECNGLKVATGPAGKGYARLFADMQQVCGRTVAMCELPTSGGLDNLHAMSANEADIGFAQVDTWARASALGHHMGSSPSTRTRSSSDHAVALRFMRKLILPFFPIGTGRTKFSTIFFNNDRFCGA